MLQMQASCVPSRAFKALAIYDYFKAKNLFYKCNKKQPNTYACFGLAVIYSRSDNPFSNTDSALRYINLASNGYHNNPKPKQFSGFMVNNQSLAVLCDSIAIKQLRVALKINTVAVFDKFLATNYMAGAWLRKQAIAQRDELEFKHIVTINNSDSTNVFLRCHPLSMFYAEARQLKERQQYEEETILGTAEVYISFIKKYPKSSLVKQAYEKLLAIYRFNADVAGLAFFVKNYPRAPQAVEAWKLLFSLSVKAYTFSELKHFLEEYPAFPLKNSILKELELNKRVLYPYQLGDFTGFINEKGKLVIEPVYDAATDFFEGLSVVTKNDTVFFINKENVNPFGKIYSDAMVFRNGLAPVKLAAKWFLINRQGQVVSHNYDEINELSGSVYVVKAGDKYGAIDQYGQIIIEPKFYKLGDFVNGMAYYATEEGYGFVSLGGQVHKPEFEWISDFDAQNVAIVKQNNKFGLINNRGKIMLEPQYDLLVKASGVYIVVSSNTYGFFDAASGCYIATVQYEYTKEKNSDYYTNGSYFRLLKKNGQLIVNRNGHVIVGSDNFTEMGFISNGLMRVKKKKKYGFIDAWLNVQIPFRFNEAEDFSDSVAVVRAEKKYMLVGSDGAEIYVSDEPIKKISRNYYETNGELKTIINNMGQVVARQVANVGWLNPKLLVITFNSGEIKLLND